MSTNDDIYARISDDWRKALEDGRNDDALNTAVMGYLFFVNSEKEKALDFIAFLAHSLEYIKPFSQTQNCCSFCGKSSDYVELYAGSSAFICNECITLLSKKSQ